MPAQAMIPARSALVSLIHSAVELTAEVREDVEVTSHGKNFTRVEGLLVEGKLENKADWSVLGRSRMEM